MENKQQDEDRWGFVDKGQGDPVVLVHSSASSKGQWRGLVERLSPHFRVIAPNLCGYGAPTAETERFSFQDDLTRVRRFVELAGGPVHLVGHSYGGLLAILTARDNPDHVRSLTIIEPVCFHLLEEAGEQAAFEEIRQARDRQTAAVADDRTLDAAEGFITYWMGPEAWAAMPDDRRLGVSRMMPKVVAEWPGAFNATTQLAQYGSFPWSTLLVCAADTTLAAGGVANLIRQRLNDHEFVTIAKGGHMSPVTNPEPVNEAIESFLNRR